MPSGLIQQGAAPALAPNDVRDALPIFAQAQTLGGSRQSANTDTSIPEQRILTLLGKTGALSLVQLEDRLGRPPGLFSEIFELELQGLLERRPGNLIALKKAV